MKKRQKNQTIFSAELFSCRRSAEGGLARQPVGVVLFTNSQKKPLKSPRGENKRIASYFPLNYSLLLGKPALSRNLFLRNKANFISAEISTSTYIRVVYNAFSQKTKNGANPNKANQSQFQSLRSSRQKNRKYLAWN